MVVRSEVLSPTRWVHRNHPSSVDSIELYDHAKDPQENVNLANDPARAKLISQLTAQMEQGWRGAMPKRR